MKPLPVTCSVLMLLCLPLEAGRACAQERPGVVGRYEQPHSLPYFDWMAVSPDGVKVAISPAGSSVYIRKLDASPDEVGRNSVVHSLAAGFDDALGGADSLRWSDDSSRLYLGVGSLRPVTLRPAFMTLDGVIHENPEPSHSNGPLDGILYAGGGGLAVGQFGTRAYLRWPRETEETPTFATVDTNTGEIRAALTFEDALRSRLDRETDSHRLGLWKASAALMADGRVRLLAQMSHATTEGSGGTDYVWMVWTETKAPVLLDDPYPGGRGALLLSPDGKVVLSTSSLTAISPCPADTVCPEAVRPAEGMVAALHDVETGRKLWEIRGVAQTFYPPPAPAISPDGRYALIGLPANDGTGASAALVSMETGQTLTTIPVDTTTYHVGFARHGRLIWIHGAGEILTYDLANLISAAD